eukprot:SAG25_NODE_6390_length_564_cov_0.707527_1_plen_77_part_01
MCTTSEVELATWRTVLASSSIVVSCQERVAMARRVCQPRGPTQAPLGNCRHGASVLTDRQTPVLSHLGVADVDRPDR